MRRTRLARSEGFTRKRSVYSINNACVTGGTTMHRTWTNTDLDGVEVAAYDYAKCTPMSWNEDSNFRKSSTVIFAARLSLYPVSSNS